MAVNSKDAERAVETFLKAVGVDMEEQNMRRTPARVAEMYAYLFGGLGRDPAEAFGPPIAADAGGLIAVRGIPFFSMCEHHLVPFYGTVDIVYAPAGGRIAGFSRFVEAVEIAAHRPQLQERLTQDIADAVQRGLGASGVLVLCRATQLCMTLREGGSYGTETTTSASLGAFATDNAACQQAWMMVGSKEEHA
ncbi:GTP cyclohydrolase I [Selenomonas sp.]|uniref:GTP cyclohydrolase I n=1 Tax=Selenomonas sp. TaxID=2053611 RepID=UPI002A757CA3|nr:GTP cyclohydrolase I [Selenomonas sp.]MDY3298685.1 GTP cyclohydrolase I [Selenomonas sp.]MDY4417053.1 GTP cyclohydrolase I [Selenomonas sp.]